MKSLDDADLRIVAVPQAAEAKNTRLFIEIAAVIICCVLGFALVAWQTQLFHRDLSQEVTDLQRQNQQLSQDYQRVQSELANVKTGAAVDRAAAEQVRVELRDYQTKVEQLSEDINFYQNLMDPKSGKRGLDAYRFEVFKTPDPELYRYRLVLQQLGTGQRNIKTDVTVLVTGIAAGEPVEHNIETLVHESTPWQATISFRYYVNLEGMLRLPEGFIPESTSVALDQRSKPTKSFNFNWQVLETN